MNSVQIRCERADDWAAIRQVNESAFGCATEATLVAELRREALPVISMVAEDGGTIVGHIMFSPVVLPGHPALKVMGLAPMAVLPERQRQGIGSAMVHAGLEACRQLGFGAVVVLGHPGYYPRFGFTPAVRFGIGCEYEVPDEAFMIVELYPGYLVGVTGTFQYHAVFRNL